MANAILSQVRSDGQKNILYTRMAMFKKLMIAAAIGLTLSPNHAQAGVRFRFGIALPVFIPPPRPVYVAPPPVYMVPAPPPAPIYLRPAPPPAYTQPSPASMYAQPTAIPASR
jgi:hypothetical protein